MVIASSVASVHVLHHSRILPNNLFVFARTLHAEVRLSGISIAADGLQSEYFEVNQLSHDVMSSDDRNIFRETLSND